MSANRGDKLPPVTKDCRETHRDQEHSEICFVEKPEPGKQTDKESLPDFAILVPADCEIKTGAATNKTRNRDAPIEHRNKKIRWIESQQYSRDDRRSEPEPPSGAQHQQQQRDELPEQIAPAQNREGRSKDLESGNEHPRFQRTEIRLDKKRKRPASQHCDLVIGHVLAVDLASDEVLRHSGEDRLVIIESRNGQILFRQQYHRGSKYRPDGNDQR